jgi:hypothetical protein
MDTDKKSAFLQSVFEFICVNRSLSVAIILLFSASLRLGGEKSLRKNKKCDDINEGRREEYNPGSSSSRLPSRLRVFAVNSNWLWREPR